MKPSGPNKGEKCEMWGTRGPVRRQIVGRRGNTRYTSKIALVIISFRRIGSWPSRLNAPHLNAIYDDLRIRPGDWPAEDLIRTVHVIGSTRCHYSVLRLKGLLERLYVCSQLTYNTREENNRIQQQIRRVNRLIHFVERANSVAPGDYADRRECVRLKKMIQLNCYLAIWFRDLLRFSH